MLEDKAVVVFSGGQDSTTCLFWAKERYRSLHAVIFDYGQRHKEEIQCAVDIANEQGVPYKVFDMGLLNQLTANALTRENISVQAGEAGESPSTFVAGRNHLFLSFAAVYAREMGAKHIITGVCETDFSGYPDCRDVFVKSLNVTLNLAMDEQFVIHTPLMWLNKKETWALADKMGQLEYIRAKTLTCYEGIRGDGCGTCPSCQLRQNGLDLYLREKAGAGQ
ncbi:7-cyano-7-deazaguanine synthase QueC [Shouchella clausii]|uniref:7-cyano-7-deazaguanine synthase n=3 Tax=Shouchella TaxID=2893057 RepID=QUEC_SHOC1|nr:MULTISPECIES: 7-cyano-7-deazaguanine synthase QueC [Shouchella]Q5WG41.1 RecName: Full=7-cyano-7-deazaguanine synthase; AltName: Full=7-cyano-7-carbaguanine synthase; AltName: Full=PreQ(0) synthase; AltName: Full=Queuosine biosynthesis protein QueC [Shouchella clausii KSM-K16]ALA54986.1 Queuosine Biosynthesis QueC ATPase [Shouchella clausii]KKI87946.1 7-cyano-7-deazaguanine synthase [Shouchella clausii]MBU3230962.1 7-cyano-7-deazaguanine synthase QueC [Shouchella clausii]MBU3262963.1 7-cyano